MIVTQTPLRVSLLGGGTDFPDFYLKEDGCVLTSAINRYIFVIIKERYDDKIRMGYSTTELVDDIDSLQHELARESLRLTGLRKRVEIATMADIPSSGSGLGSSSAVTVGLLNAIYHYLSEPRDPATLAREACEVEIGILGKPIGVQDQHIAAHGGQRLIRFGRDGNVAVEKLGLRRDILGRLSQNLVLFFTNRTRRAETILAEQSRNIDLTLDVLRQMKRLAETGADCLRSGRLDEFGLLLDEGWNLKKRLASRISDPEIDGMYETALRAGALGGKITGAGGGGFLLLYCPPDRQDDVRLALNQLPELPFDLEDDGTKVIFSQGSANRYLRTGSQVYA